MDFIFYVLISILCLITFLSITNNVFHYYFKMGYYYGVVTLSGLIIIPFALLRPNSVKNIRLLIFTHEL